MDTLHHMELDHLGDDHLGDDDSLPADLEDILEGQTEPSQSTFNESDEFDPAALLSEPIFGDSQGDLNITSADLGMPPDPAPISEDSSASSISNSTNTFGLLQKQQAFQQQQSQPFQNLGQQTPQHQFGAFNQGVLADPANQFMGFDQGGGAGAGGGGVGVNQQNSQNNSMGDVQMQQQAVNLRVQEVQEQIQKVQQQIQQVQLQSSQLENHNSMHSKQQVSPQQQQQQQHQAPRKPQRQPQQQQQQQFQAAQGMMKNDIGRTRAPPGRSVSMPVQRMHGSSLGSGRFFMQKQQQQQQQQSQPQNTLLAMRNSLAASSVQNPMQNSMQGFGQQMDNSNMSMMQSNMDTSMNGSMHNSLNGSMQNGLNGSMHNGLNGSMHGNMNGGLGGLSMGSNHGTSSAMQGQGNMSNMHPSLANPGELLSTGSFNPMEAQQAFQQNGPANVNEAMEKLCESMRRSAMSRSLVKQLSGRAMPQGSRGIARSNSNRVQRSMSGRSISRANSGKGLTRVNPSRSIQRSHSARGGEEVAAVPIRKMSIDTKHRIQRDSLSSSQHMPSRGVFRHKSQGAMPGVRKTRLQIDDNNLGNF